MGKRKLISLRRVLLGYLVRTAATCVLVAAGWFLVLLWLIRGGWVLSADQAAQASQKAAQDILPGMTAETFDGSQLDPLCRYALFADAYSQEVLVTNMDKLHLQWALEVWQGRKRWHFGYTQYYMNAKLQDGTLCLLQFDYSVPYADPALRGKLPDIQTIHIVLGSACCWGWWCFLPAGPESFWRRKRHGLQMHPGWWRRRSWTMPYLQGQGSGSTTRHCRHCKPWAGS